MSTRVKQSRLEAILAMSMFVTATSFKSTVNISNREKRAFVVPKPFTLSALVLPSPKRSQTQRNALIYSWDDDENIYAVEECSLSDVSSTSPLALADSIAGDLCAKISRDSDRIGSLARIATAFSPPDRRFRLGDIERVAAVGVDGGRIEIQAVVPQGDGCVTLLVHVDFPFRCDQPKEDEKEACVLGNLDMLDREAVDLIERLGLGGSALDRKEGCFEPQDVLQAYNPLSKNGVMVEECEQMRLLLNEDSFSDSVLALAQWALRISSSGMPYDYSIEKATVSEVTPEGLSFAAEATTFGEKYIIQLQLPFEKRAFDAEELQEAVMDAVSKSHHTP